jgi:hypothetical protein
MKVWKLTIAGKFPEIKPAHEMWQETKVTANRVPVGVRRGLEEMLRRAALKGRKFSFIEFKIIAIGVNQKQEE